MAGKTFHGVGDVEAESPPLGPEGAAPSLDDESKEAYSGPTVVDEAKIAESLQRLRSLDQPLPPSAGGVSMSVMDSGSAEPTRIGDPIVATVEPIPLGAPVSPLGRPTAVGHSVGPSVISQQSVPLDPLRGTMFGHSIHLPDVNTPESALEELSSGSLIVVPRPSAEELQPFLPDRTTRPAQQHPQLPSVVVQPLKRPELFHEPEPSSTEVVSGLRQRVRGRTAVAVVTVAAAAGVVFAWIYSGDGAYGPPPPPTPIRGLARPTATLPPPAAVPSPSPPPTPAAAAEVPTVIIPATPRAAEAEVVPSERPQAPPSDRASRRHERRAAAAAAAAAAVAPETGGEAKPTEAIPAEAKAAEAKAAETKAVEPTEPKATAEPKAEAKLEAKVTKAGKKKKAEVEEDPDATMAPSD